MHPRRVQEARPMEGFVLAPCWNDPESNAYITSSSVKEKKKKKATEDKSPGPE